MVMSHGPTTTQIAAFKELKEHARLIRVNTVFGSMNLAGLALPTTGTKLRGSSAGAAIKMAQDADLYVGWVVARMKPRAPASE